MLKQLPGARSLILVPRRDALDGMDTGEVPNRDLQYRPLPAPLVLIFDMTLLT